MKNFFRPSLLNFSLVLFSFATGAASAAPAVDLYTANYDGDSVETISAAGVASPLPATGLNAPIGLAFDQAGNLYVANAVDDSVSKITPGGVVSTFATGFSEPSGLAFDGAGNLYVANYTDNSIYKVTPAGVVSTFVPNTSGLNYPWGLAFDSAGNLYVANFGGNSVTEVTPGGGVFTFATGFDGPIGLTFDSAGYLYVANAKQGTISKVTTGGTLSTFVSGGLSFPAGLAFSSTNLYVVSEGSGTISTVAPNGALSTLATGVAGAYMVAFGPPVAAQLQVLLPGETAAPGTATGKTGAPIAETAGGTFSVTVNAVDANFNLVAQATPTVAVSSSDSAAILPANAPLVNGTRTFNVTLNTGGPQTVTVSDTAAGSPLTAGVSSSLNLNATAAVVTSISSSTPSQIYKAGQTVPITVSFSAPVTVSGTPTLALNDGGTAVYASGSGTSTVSFDYLVGASDTSAHLDYAGTGALLLNGGTINSGDFPATLTLAAPGAGGSLGANTTLVIDTTLPVATIGAPAQTITASGPVDFTVTWSDANLNVSSISLAAPQVTVNTTGTVAYGLVTVTGTGATRTVQIGSITGNGTLGLSLPAGTALDLAGNAAAAAGPGTVVVVDNTAPTVTVSTPSPMSTNAGGSVSYTVTYYDANFASASLNASEVSLTNTAVTGTITVITNNSTNFTVVISGLAGTGPQSLQIAAGTATDLAGNSALAVAPVAGFTVGAALATHLLVSLPATVTAGVAFNGTVTALDQFNNTVPGYAGEVHFTSSDGTAVLPANATLINGTGSFSFTLNTLGSQTIGATDVEISSITGTSGVTVVATPATHLVVSLPATATAGVAVSGSVTALDQFNHLVTGYTNTIHFTSSDSAAVLPADMTLAGGSGTASFTLKTAGNQTVSAADTLTPSIAGISGNVTVSASAATHLVVSLPGAAVKGTAFTGTVTALDAYGNTANSYSGTVHFTSSDSAAVLPANATLVNGTGSFSFTLNTTGGQTVSAADTVNSSISGISGSLAVGAVASGVQLYIANAGDDDILMLPSGGSLAEFAGGLSFPYGLAFDSASNLYVSSFGDNMIAQITPGGSVSVFATNDLDEPTGLAFDSAGNLYAANFGNNTVVKITPGGSSSVFASGMNQPFGLAFDGAGNLYVANGGSGTIAKITPGGSVSTFASGFADPVGLAMDSAGSLYVANYGSSSISKVTSGGAVTTFVAASAGLDQPTGLAIDSSGNLYVANLADGSIAFVTPAGAVSTLVTGSGEISTPEFIAVRSSPVTTTTTVVAASANPAVAGQPVTFTSTVSGSGGTPSGTVTFYDGATLLGVGPLTNGVAVVTTSGLAVGTGHSITAVYSGSVNFSASTSAILSETINSATVATTTSINASLNPAGAGQAVTFTATVSGSGGTPTGTVTFFDGATSLGASTLTNGVATFTTSSLGAGSSHGITAEYSGGLSFNGSTSASLTENINAAAISTTTMVSALVNPAVSGQTVTFTATVSGSGGTPTGTVTFYDGGSFLGIRTLINGVAVYMTSSLAIGSGHSITGVYSGDASFNASTSAVWTETVNLAAANLLLSATNETVFGQPAVFTVTLNAAAPGAGVPTGTVTFYYNGTNSFATNTLAAGAAGITNADLPAGTNVITAVYSGDGNFTSGTVTATQVVQQAATTVLLSATATNSIAGQAVTFTAVVTAVAPGAGTPAGAVTFYYDGTNNLGSNSLTGGTAVLSSAALPAGTNLITAVYSGNADFTLGTAPAVTEVTLVMTNGLALVPGVVSNTGVLFRQTGLMQQQVTVTNLTAGTYAAVRLTVQLSATNKAAGITVADATGADTNGNPYLLYNYAVPPGGSVSFDIEYSVPNRTTIPNPVITVAATAAGAPLAVPAGTPQPVAQAVAMTDAGNAFLVGFRTQANATYYVLYSTNLVNWCVVQPAVKGNGSVVQWVDVGPPLTQCPPMLQSRRFYQVIKAQ